MSGQADSLTDEAGLERVDKIWNVSRETSARLVRYVNLLRHWQARINLIAPSTLSSVWDRHVADSAQVYALNPKAQNWIDIGSGAGFPGLIIAIFMADTGAGRVDLIESNGKKCAFMKTVVRETDLAASGVDVVVHNGRIEDVLPTLDVPDAISARALAPLKDLLRLTEPYLQDACTCTGLFQKGRDHDAEISDARKDWTFDLDTTQSRFGDGSVILNVKNATRKTGSNA